jgi:ABC-type Fe3+-citrate transport system substrate-binding protein
MKFKKTVAALALLLALVMMLGACSSEIQSSEEEARVVGTCGEHEIRYEELRYLTMNYKLELAAIHGVGIFDSAETGAQYEEQLRAYGG